MQTLKPIRSLLSYSDAMNEKILVAAVALSDAQLDQAFDMGMGTLRKTLAHIYVGEMVWLERWQGNTDCKWPPYETTLSPSEILDRCRALIGPRDVFVGSLDATRLAAVQVYRDSRGSLFRAMLLDMILQGITHSTHHRAQAVNMIRRAGGAVVEVDYMYAHREPA